MDLTVGRIVHVKNVNNDCRPMIVVKLWNPTSCNGVLFRDGSNDLDDDFEADDRLTSWLTSVVAGDGVREWHDPRECANA